MAEFFKFVIALITLVIFQIYSVKACCVPDGRACTVEKANKCCTPICLDQYKICGKDCLPQDSSCTVDNDCCAPLACNQDGNSHICCAAPGASCSVDQQYGCCNPDSLCVDSICT